MFARFPKETLYRWLDLLAAVLILLVTDGLLLDTGDMHALLSSLAKIHHPELFAHDLCYSAPPDFCHSPVVFLMSALPEVFPLRHALAALNVLSHLILLVALRRLATTAGGQPVCAILLALLLAGVRNVFLGYYYLLGKGYSPQATSAALGLLALSLMLDKRKASAAAALALALVFSIRLGVFAATLLFVVWFLSAGKKARGYAAGAGALLVLGISSLLYWRFHGSAQGTSLDEIVRIWMYARAPWHFLPSFQPAWAYGNIGVVAAFLALVFSRPPTREARLLCTLAFLGIACVLTGAINNHYLIEPLIVLINPLEMGLFVTAIFCALAGAFLSERLQGGYYVSSLAVLVTWDLQTRILLVLLLALADRAMGRTALRQVWLKDLLALAACAAVLGVQYALASPSLQETPSAYVSLQKPLQIIAISYLLLLTLRFLQHTPSPRRMAAIAGAVVVRYAWAGSILAVFYPVNREFLEVCDAVRRLTPIDACVLVDPEWDSFQHFSQRSAFGTLKAAPFGRWNEFPEWFRRLQAIGYFSSDVPCSELSREVPRDPEAFGRMRTEGFCAIARKWDVVTHIIVKKDVELLLPLLFEGATYRLYAVQRNGCRTISREVSRHAERQAPLPGLPQNPG